MARGGAPIDQLPSFDYQLGSARARVKSALARALADSSTDVAGLLSAKNSLLDRYIELSRSPVELRLVAYERYTGVLWRALAPELLDESALVRLLVPSAYYGLVRATDPIIDYRLSFTTSLAPLGKLSMFWAQELQSLRQFFKGKTVVNLLPNEHRAPLAQGVLSEAQLIDVSIEQGSSPLSGHNAKHVKGLLARAILSDGLPALDTFSHAHWTLTKSSDSSYYLS